ncbi:MAG: transglutaminase-like cysteine peptidase [Elusimicrobiota bacterium]|jgi:predicted transglutaminase-like cysteine proteinase
MLRAFALLALLCVRAESAVPSFEALGLRGAAAIVAGGDIRSPEVPPVPPSAQASPMLWGARELLQPTPVSGLVRWQDMLERHRAGRSSRWRTVFEDLRGRPEKEQMELVHSRWNQVPYKPDSRDNGWATPEEFMRDGGDCEEYAVAKYFSLRELGWSSERLRILVVHHHLLGLKHAVLLVRLEGSAWILDNLSWSVYRTEENVFYTPLFSFNEDAWWGYKTLR